MLECHYSFPARQKIAAMQKEGKSDDTIVASFVQESGLSALATPPAEGFNLLGYLMPYIALGIGLVGIFFYVKRFRRRPGVAGDLPEVDPAMLARYQERIDKDMAKLE
jgi:cytochrome c-type biogenesis protein CcmH